MRIMIKKSLLFASALVLCLSLVLAGCEGEGTSDPSAPEQTADPAQTQEDSSDPAHTPDTGGEQETGDGTEEDTSEQQTEPADVTYTVRVTGSNGLPRQGALLGVSKNGEEVATAITAADGSASFSLAPDTYEVVVKALLGEGYDPSVCVLTPERTELGISLYGTPLAGEEIYAYNAQADDHVAYDAKRVAEGTTLVTLSAQDMTYYLFVPSQGGTFRLSLDESVNASIGYYGSTSFVMTESVAAEENNAILIDAYDDMVYTYAFVIGIRAEDELLTECMLTVEYYSERETSEGELPWTEIMPEGELGKYTKGEGSYHTFDMEGDVVSLVYNESDGYYHVGSADGPLVLINLAGDTAYMDALITVCANTRLGVYVYDEDGKLLSKDSYNDMITAYNDASDGGYYPLDRTLLDAMLVLGEYIGWYDASSPMYLFADKVLTVENAHLFACVYLQ